MTLPSQHVSSTNSLLLLSTVHVLSNLQTNGYDYDVSRTCIWHLGKCKRRHNQRMPHRLLQHLRCTLHLLTGGSTMPLFLQMRWMMNTLFFQHGANRLYSRHYNGFDFSMAKRAGWSVGAPMWGDMG